MKPRANSLIGLDDLSEPQIQRILSKAQDIENGHLDTTQTMVNRILAPLFFQESSRTFINSTTSFLRMGGRVLPIQVETTRLNKHWSEPIRDFVQITNSCCDYLIVRSPDTQTVLDFARWSDVPVFNAGNGFGRGSEHPAQSLVDLFVIQQRYQRQNLRILMVGGRHIRTTRTQTKLFTRFGHKVDLIPSAIEVDNGDIEEFYAAHVDEYSDIREIDLSAYDVIYHNGADEDHNAHPSIKICVDRELLESRRFEGIVMHSLPRLKELSDDVDDTPFNGYFAQMHKSVHVFQAMFAHLQEVNAMQSQSVA